MFFLKLFKLRHFNVLVFLKMCWNSDAYSDILVKNRASCTALVTLAISESW